MMTVHTMSVLDNKTKMEIILEDAGYNQACFWLEQTMPKGTFIRCCKGNSPFIIIQYKDRTFWYDETRMLLLGK